jgi:AraC-like DNA-binding protein
VSGSDSSPESSVVDAAYHSIEEVNEVLHTAGWDGEFRQLAKGRVTSRWQSRHLGPSSLSFHRLDKHIHVRQAPPSGCVALAIVPQPHFLLVDGAQAGGHDAILMHADSGADFVVPNRSECLTLAVPRSDFEASARALFPRMHLNGRPVRVLECAPSRWSALQREMTRLLRDGRMSAEDVSNLLARFLDLMTGEPENRVAEKSLGNGSTRRVARRAQEYIEEHYPGTIRMEDVCGYTGVSLRTLQRSFAEYFQVSPSEFIRARRLHAARQGLLAADSSHRTVSQIAIDNGFTHLGRFSVEYREHFGESPRATLAKRAPRWRGAVGTG